MEYLFNNCDIEVKLMNPEEVKDFVKRHGEFATVCYNTNKKYALNVGKSVLSDGHFSGSRADYFKFEVTLVPRYTCDQIVRHEQGCIKNVQSQRYCDLSSFKMYASDIIMQDEELVQELENHVKETRERYLRMKTRLKEKYPKAKEEWINDQIRTILPIGCETKLNVAFTIEGLIHFCNVRLCRRADKPIQEFAKMLKNEVLAVAPIYEPYLVPQCERDLYCKEKHGCGAYPSKKELQLLIELGEEYCKNEDNQCKGNCLQCNGCKPNDNAMYPPFGDEFYSAKFDLSEPFDSNKYN